MQLTTKGYVDKGLNSPAFTGIPTAPTAGAGCDTRQIATCEFVQNAISNISEGIGNIGVYKKSGIRVGEGANATSIVQVNGLTKQELYDLADDGYDLCILDYDGSSVGSFVFMLRNLKTQIGTSQRFLLSAGDAASSAQQTRLWFNNNDQDENILQIQYIQNRNLTFTAYKISSVSPVHGQVIKFTEDTTWTVPDGVKEVDVYLVGGGKDGEKGSRAATQGGAGKGGKGGDGGDIAYYPNFSVTPNSSIPVTIGAGGGGASKFGILSSAFSAAHDDVGDGSAIPKIGMPTNICPLTGEIYGLRGLDGATNYYSDQGGSYNIAGFNIVHSGGTGNGAARYHGAGGGASADQNGGSCNQTVTPFISGTGGNGRANSGNGGGGSGAYGYEESSAGNAGKGGSGIAIIRIK